MFLIGHLGEHYVLYLTQDIYKMINIVVLTLVAILTVFYISRMFMLCIAQMCF